MKLKDLETAVINSFKKEKWVNFNCNNKHSQELSENGITIIENFIPEEDCDKYYKQILNFINENQDFKEGMKEENNTLIVNRGLKWDTDYNMLDIFDIDNLIPELKMLRNNEFITNIVNESNSLDLEMQNLNVYYTKESSPRVLHVDNYVVSQYKAFLYLTDVTSIEQGPYMYVKGSHLCSDKKILSYIDNYENDRYITDMRKFSYDDAHPCLAKKGTLIITDQNGVHGAHPQADAGERMLVMMHFCKAKIDPR